MPSQYRSGSENIFTFEKIVNFIENEKANSSVSLRLVHSDESGQLLKSNSVCQSHPSILSFDRALE
jgi:hypothetical protein